MYWQQRARVRRATNDQGHQGQRLIPLCFLILLTQNRTKTTICRTMSLTPVPGTVTDTTDTHGVTRWSETGTGSQPQVYFIVLNTISYCILYIPGIFYCIVLDQCPPSKSMTVLSVGSSTSTSGGCFRGSCSMRFRTWATCNIKPGRFEVPR